MIETVMEIFPVVGTRYGWMSMTAGDARHERRVMDSRYTPNMLMLVLCFLVLLAGPGYIQGTW